MSAWDRVAALARAQAEAAADRRLDELAAVQAELAALLRPLPAPPAGAEAALREALAQARAAELALAGALAERRGQLERLRAGRRAAVAYAGPRRRGGLEARA
ncbi:MAG TPA: hypothetical protein VFB42_03210 [Gaiellaceae bacterium]|nr:hypothetical protein [Gaiellaceae bacterium]